MAIYNLGSINADYFYNVPHLPGPGETLAATSFGTGLGGKGANQSVAAARAGSETYHIGAVGPDGQWAIDRIKQAGVNTDHITTVKTPTAHAIINIDTAGENAIVIFSGANATQTPDGIAVALAAAAPGDLLLLQNETNAQVEAAKIALGKSMRVVYSAAPFSVDVVRDMLPHISILLVNQVESEQLCAALGTKLADIPVPELIVTKGSNGADWYNLKTGETLHMPSFPVQAVDTTAAGDTFAGYFAAGIDQNLTVENAMRLATAAAAVKVTRFGTADVIPTRADVDAFLNPSD
jgi:ribokinase